MLFEHALIIHLVDMVTGKDDDVLRLFRADRIDVLIDRIGRTHIPIFADPLHGREDFNELSHFPAHNIPAFANMPVQRERLVLRENVDPAQVGIDAIGECDIDDAIYAAEGDRGLGAIAGQRVEAFTRASGQQDS